MPKDDNLAFKYYSQANSIARNSESRDDDIKADIYYRIALCLYIGRVVDQDDLLALRYVNEAEYYSYCDRFENKFMWQSTAKRIEKLRDEILENLQSYQKLKGVWEKTNPQA